MSNIETTAPSAELKPEGGLTRWYALGVFTLVYTMINIDRNILSVMIEPIKHEFHLNDSEVGLLTGIAFALFFGVAGIPFGRWTDRGNRKTILGISLFVFSLMTAAGGIATNFVQLLLARVVVGAGEAGGGPATISMTSDYFAPDRRATVISIYYLGSPMAQILIFFFGGMIVSAYGWRSGFLAAGCLGLALLTLIVLTLPEPRRRTQTGGLAGEAPPFRTALKFILGQPALIIIFCTSMITSAASSATGAWAVSFMIRSHHLPLRQAGAILALTIGCVGALGVASSGWIIDRLARRDVRWRTWYCMCVQIVGLPAFLLFLLAPSIPLALPGLAVWSICQGSLYGPVVSLCQNLVGPRMRGSVMAIFYFVSNFVGFGIGPQVAGIVSDLLHPVVGSESLRYALLCFAVTFLFAAFLFYRASRTLERDLARGAEAA